MMPSDAVGAEGEEDGRKDAFLDNTYEGASELGPTHTRAKTVRIAVK